MKEKVKNNVTKEERRQMKQKLFRWGRTVDFCRNKQREIEKLQMIIKNYLMLEKNVPFLGKKDADCFIEAKQLYEMEVNKMEEYICKEMKQYSEMERYIEQLNYDEQMFLKLRYQKGHQYDYSAVNTHKSRAKCFRDHDLILDKLILICRKQKAVA